MQEATAATPASITPEDARDLIQVQADRIRQAMRFGTPLHVADGDPDGSRVRALADAAQDAYERLADLEDRAADVAPGVEGLFGRAGALALLLVEAEVLIERTGMESLTQEMWNAFHVLVDAMGAEARHG